MDSTRRDHLLATLPEPAAAALREAFATTDSRARRRHAKEALEEVRYPSRYGTTPLAGELDEADRALLELVAELGATRGAGMPRAPWSVRRWLGLDPPGIMERVVELDGESLPIWKHLASLGGRPWAEGHAAVRRIMDALSPVERLQLWDEGERGAYQKVPQLKTQLEDVDASCGPWAAEMADRLLEVGPDRCDDATLMRVWAGLVRGGVEIEERWDVLFPQPGRADDERFPHYDEVLSWVDALPEERRAPALAAAYRARKHPRYAIESAMDVLVTYPSLPLVQVVLDRASGRVGPPRQAVIRGLLDRTLSLPEAQALCRAELLALGPTVELRCGEAFRPTGWDALDDDLRAVMKHCEGAWDLTWGQSDGADGASWETTSIYRVQDGNGLPLWTVVLQRDEDGSIFRAHGTEEVGYVSQRRVEMEPRPVAEALEALLGANRPA